jgi:hypothetical protein
LLSDRSDASEGALADTFQLRQIVRLVRSPVRSRGVSVPETFRVVRIMPADTNGEISYRIKSDLSELAVRAHEIKI